MNKIEGCSFLNGTADNVILKWILGLIKDSLPQGLIHPCPYSVNAFFHKIFKIETLHFQGEVNIKGVQLDFAKHLSAIPNGLYREKYRLYDDNDDNIFNFKILIEIYKAELRDWK